MRDFRIELTILMNTNSTEEEITGKVNEALAKLAELDSNLTCDNFEITEDRT